MEGILLFSTMPNCFAMCQVYIEGYDS